MQNQLYAEHEMIFFKEGILGSNLIKKIYLLVHLRSELILPRDIKDIDNDIRNLDSLYEDPFIIAGKIEDLNRKKEFKLIDDNMKGIIYGGFSALFMGLIFISINNFDFLRIRFE